MPLLPKNEFSRRLAIDPWPGAGIEVDVTADAAERAALARRFNLVEVRSLRGHGRLERGQDSMELILRGRLEADVVQACVVSLEPVPAKLRKPVERRYRAERAPTGQDRFQPIGALDLDDDEAEVEPVVGREIDLGEAFAEALGLALDPYPRAADAAAIEATALGPYVRLGPAEPGKPLAALRQLEKRAR
jgi:uncharacterized metal-binding protein YceD (DUF177 family)